MKNRNRETGKTGKEAAARHLRGKGFEIISINFSTKSGETDIIFSRRKPYGVYRCQNQNGKIIRDTERDVFLGKTELSDADGDSISERGRGALRD